MISQKERGIKHISETRHRPIYILSVEQDYGRIWLFPTQHLWMGSHSLVSAASTTEIETSINSPGVFSLPMVKHSLKPGATLSIISLQDPCMTLFQVCPGAAVNPVSPSYGQGLFRSRSTFLMSPDSRGFVANSSHALALLEQSPSALSNSNYPARPRHIPTHTVCLTTNTARPGAVLLFPESCALEVLSPYSPPLCSVFFSAALLRYWSWTALSSSWSHTAENQGPSTCPGNTRS